MPAAIDTRRPSMVVECVSTNRFRAWAVSTITFCASGEKPMNVGSEKWLVPPYFRKSGRLSMYASIALRSSCGDIAISSSPPPCAMKSFICSWNNVSWPMTRLNEKEYGPLHPRMLPAARMRAPT